ncbi:hypothetical protein AtNW77_Chr1g0009651 [Arabidopsis thaliana]
MAKMMMLQQHQPSFSLLTSSLSDFNGAKLHLQVQVFFILRSDDYHYQFYQMGSAFVCLMSQNPFSTFQNYSF